MRDIKTKKINKVINKIEKVENFQTAIYLDKSKDLGENFWFGKTLLSTVAISLTMYLFFVTSTIFYAVNSQKYISQIENINNIASEIKTENSQNEMGENLAISDKKSKISFISKNSDTAITLK